MGLSVEDEVRCPKSGYSIDMLVQERSMVVASARTNKSHHHQQLGHVGSGV
jgi:hypothetical protein